MALSSFSHVKITGISAVVPSKEINIFDEAKYYDNNLKKIERLHKVVGFYKRRVVEDGITPSDLSIQAAERLISDMKIDRGSIDCLIFVVQRPDFSAPATSFYIHNKLKLSSECAVIDINHGCPGWVYGLWNACSMLEARTCKRILLLVGDTPSAGMDLSNRISAPVFGDGGVATLLDYSESAENIYFDIYTQSKDYEAIINPASGARLHFTRDNESLNSKLLQPVKTKSGYNTKLVYGFMDGLSVFRFTIDEVPKSLRRVVNYSRINIDTINFLLLHQANKQIISSIASSFGFPIEKTPYDVFENFGNSTMCSIPMSINYLFKEGISQRMNLLCSGFGNGLAVASALISLTPDVYLSGVVDFMKPNDFINPEKFADYWIDKLKNSL